MTRGRSAVPPLVFFTALYLLPLVVAPSWLWALVCFALAVLVASSSLLVQIASKRLASTPSERQQRWVSCTSIAEGIVALMSLAVAAVTGSWWIVLPLVLTAVTVHSCALRAALRRSVDSWSVTCFLIAMVIAWGASVLPIAWVWPAAGSLAAGTCFGYVLALRHADRLTIGSGRS